jgi:hypothetical protein
MDSSPATYHDLNNSDGSIDRSVFRAAQARLAIATAAAGQAGRGPVYIP